MSLCVVEQGPQVGHGGRIDMRAGLVVLGHRVWRSGSRAERSRWPTMPSSSTDQNVGERNMQAVIDWVVANFGADVDWKQVLLIGMSPIFLIAFSIEWQIMKGRGRREQFFWKDIAANLSLGGSYQ